MSLINTFQDFPEVKLLLLEVSTGKRKALLEKISEKLFADFGEYDIHERVVNLIKTQPRLVEELSKKAQGGKHDLSDAISQQYEEVHKRYPEFTFEIPEEHKGGFKEPFGVDGLVACIVMFYKLEEVDPTGNMKYGNWLIDVVLDWALEKHLVGYMGGEPLNKAFNIIRADRRFFEDLPKMEAYLKAYDEMKKKNELPEEYRDINKITPDKTNDSPFETLRGITAQYRAIDTGDFFKAVKENLERDKDYAIKDELHNFIIYEPLTQKGASILGMNTEWCTTYGEHCTRPEYQSRGSAFGNYDNLLIMVNKNDPDEKYQMEVGSDQFMDKDDTYVKLSNIYDKHPELYYYLLEEDLLQSPLWLKKTDKGWIVKDKNLGEFIAEFFVEGNEIRKGFVKDVLTGMGWEYFIGTHVPDLTDVYLRTEVEKNPELVEMVKKEMYKIIKEFPDEFKESEYSLEDVKTKDNLDDLFEIISEVDIFDELGDAIHTALGRAQENANEDEAYNKLINAFKDKWMVRNIDWGSGEILIEDDMVPNIIQWYNDSGYGDIEELVMVDYSPPRYGFSGDIHKDTLHDAFDNEFYEL